MGGNSAVFEAGDLLLVDEGGHGVLLVLGGEAQGEGLRLKGGAGGHIGLEAPADGGLGLPDGHLGVDNALVSISSSHYFITLFDDAGTIYCGKCT